MKILPGCFVVVGDTVEEARAKRAKLDSLVHYASAIASLSIALGHDASKFDPDGPLPEIPESNASKSGRERAIALAKRENLTVRQLAQRLGGYSGLAMVGTPKTIADEMEEWLDDRGLATASTCMFPYLPGGLDDFVDRRGARNCSAAACSGANTRARRCARISACRGRRDSNACDELRHDAGWRRTRRTCRASARSLTRAADTPARRSEIAILRPQFPAPRPPEGIQVLCCRQRRGRRPSTRRRASSGEASSLIDHRPCLAWTSSSRPVMRRRGVYRHDPTVGPHPRGSCQLTVRMSSSPMCVPWRPALQSQSNAASRYSRTAANRQRASDGP